MPSMSDSATRNVCPALCSAYTCMYAQNPYHSLRPLEPHAPETVCKLDISVQVKSEPCT